MVKKKINYLLIYTTITILIFFISYFEFIKYHKTFLWKPDGVTLHGINLYLFGEYIRDIIKNKFSFESINRFDFYNGFGMSRLGFIVTSYIEPINILGLFSNLKNYDLIYSFLVAIRCWLIGLSFSYYCWYKKYDLWITLIGSIIYTFSGYFFYAGVRHPFFLCGLIFLPLLFAGVEKIIKERKRVFFIIIVFLSIISNYYFLYMNTIILGIYLLLRIFFSINKRKEIKNIFNIIGAYILGVLIGMVILLPEIYLFLDSDRTEFIISTKNIFFYSKDWIIKNYIYMFTPNLESELWIHVGVSVYCYFTIMFIFFKRGNTVYKALFMICLLILSMPVGGLIMTAFSYVTNRWSYIFVFYLALSVVIINKKLLKPTTKICLVIGGIILVYMLFGVIYFRNYYTITSIIWMLIFYIYFLNLKILENKIKEKSKKIILLILISLNIITNGIIINNRKFGNYQKEFIAREENKNLIKEKITKEKEEIFKGFHRIENTEQNRIKLNFEVLTKNRRVAQFFNIQDKNLAEYFKRLENSKQISKVRYYSLDGRTILLNLNNIKYYIDETGKLPYGYKNIDKNLFENKYILPFGYTYSSYQLDNYNYNPLELQDLMLKNIIFSKEIKIENINKNLGTINDYRKIELKNIKYENINYKNKKYSIKNKKNKIILNFDKIKKKELYIRLKNINIENEINKTWKIKIEGNGIRNDVNIFTETSYLGTKQKNYTVNLGYINNDIDEITITFPKKGEFTIDEFEIYAVSMENYEKYIAELSKDVLKNVKFGTNTIEGNIELEVPKILCLSIPYNRGWKAYVNDKEVEILRGNIMHMAIPLEAGKHRVKLIYTVPGLELGAILSVIGIIILVIVYKKEKK